MEVNKNYFGQLVEAIVDGGAIRATKYISPKLTVKATRRLFGGKIDNRNKSVDIVLTIGPPNWREREFIKGCLAAGEPFPVKKIQLKWPKK